MLTEAELDRVCVVLVRARNPSNIGAVARAMHDFGFRRLRVVNEFPVPFEAAKSAVDASSVMASAVMHASVAEAVGDCTLVVGTTAVGERDLQQELVTLAEGAARMRAELRYPHGGRRVALVFGSEKTGLSNEELSHCNWLLTVPMWVHAGMRHASMNLGQAAAVCLYELVRDESVEPTSQNGDPFGKLEAGSSTNSGQVAGHPVVVDGAKPADGAGMERITALLNEVMERTEYTRRHAANSSSGDVRRLVRRMGVSTADATVWMGILRQVLWKLGGGKEKAEADPCAALRDDKPALRDDE